MSTGTACGHFLKETRLPDPFPSKKNASPLLAVDFMLLFSGRCVAFVYGGFRVKALRPFLSSGAPELKTTESGKW